MFIIKDNLPFIINLSSNCFYITVLSYIQQNEVYNESLNDFPF